LAITSCAEREATAAVAASEVAVSSTSQPSSTNASRMLSACRPSDSNTTIHDMKAAPGARLEF
jgi:hypothetical protein